MNIAVVGATGLVGRKIIDILEERDLTKNNNFFLFSSNKSAGKKIKINNKYIKVLELNEENFEKLKNNIDIAFFSAGGSVSLKWAEKFAQNGALVIDNSSAFRRYKNVPLIVPEVNGGILKTDVNFKKISSKTIKNNKKDENNGNFCNIIANPNCSTIGASLPLFCLSKLYKIKKIIISTYQAVSGAGQKGITDLVKNTTKKFNNVITNNIIPQIDVPLDNGYSFEEDKMNFELRKILNNKHLKISTTCVRVPITNCHSESVYVEFDKKVDINDIRTKLKKFKGIKLVDDVKNNIYPMPILCDGKDEVFVGRIRQDVTSKKAISFFLSFDNIRKGAGLNAVQILEYLLNNRN